MGLKQLGVSSSPGNYCKRKLIADRAYPAIKPVIFQKFIPGKIFPDPLGPDSIAIANRHDFLSQRPCRQLGGSLAVPELGELESACCVSMS